MLATVVMVTAVMATAVMVAAVMVAAVRATVVMATAMVATVATVVVAMAATHPFRRSTMSNAKYVSARAATPRHTSVTTECSGPNDSMGSPAPWGSWYPFPTNSVHAPTALKRPVRLPKSPTVGSNCFVSLQYGTTPSHRCSQGTSSVLASGSCLRPA